MYRVTIWFFFVLAWVLVLNGALVVLTVDRSYSPPISVLFATDRAVDQLAPCGYTDAFGPLDQGEATVRLMRRPRIGSLARQQLVSCTRFRLSELIEGLGTESSTFLFVHGYNVSFFEAVTTAATLKLDLGAPPLAADQYLLFSWPSMGKAGLYFGDSEHEETATEDLLELLRQATAENVEFNILAHSMGSRIVTRALDQYADFLGPMSVGPPTHWPVRELVLAAPDMHSELLVRRLRNLLDVPTHVTIYVAANDLPLILSEWISQTDRAGLGVQSALLGAGIDIIDVTPTERSVIGKHHSYFARNPRVIADIHGLLTQLPDPDPASRFGLELVETSNGRYWRMRP